MFKFIKKLVNPKKINYRFCENAEENKVDKNENKQVNDIPDNIDMLEALIKENLNNSSDVVVHKFESIGGGKFLISYIDGLVDTDLINRDIITPLVSNTKENDIEKCLHVSKIEQIKKISDALDGILAGNTLIYLDELNTIYSVDLKKFEKRAVVEPESESVVRGSKEGFVESIRTNTSLLRRRIKNKSLVLENIKIGKRTKTNITLAYIDDIVNKDVLKELKKRLGLIDTDAILESGYIEQFIEDDPYSIVATIGNTQKPDVVAGKILEGRVAIFCDGTPHVLTVPYLFIENLQASEDYYMRPYMASILRILRFMALFISIMLPALYVDFQTYDQEMIPTTLLITMASSREGVPFPALIEALLMLFLFELLKESGLRMPKVIGSAVSIVGALILGEAAVSAGLVSAPMVIVVAATAVASFILPSLNEVIVFYRLFFLFLSGFMGLVGIACGIIAVFMQVLSLRSFGIPFTSPASPMEMQGLKDYVIRFPLWEMVFRPVSIVKNNVKRVKKKR